MNKLFLRIGTSLQTRPLPPPEKVKKILIYRLGSLGDMVVTLPALHLIEQAFPSSKRVLLTNLPIHSKAAGAPAILDGSRLVHGFINYATGTRRSADLALLWWKIQEFRPDLLVYLAKSRGDATVQRDASFFRLCGVPAIVGLPLGDLAKSRHDLTTGLWENEAVRLTRSIRPIGSIDLDDPRSWDLRLKEDELLTAKQALVPLGERNFVVCGLGTKMQAKDWGIENWRLLLGRLSAKLADVGLVLIGAAEDAEASDLAARNWSGPVVNLCGKLSPRETSAAMRGAALFLGPDSGPMHLAAAARIPCVIAFASRTHPGIWFPYGKSHQVIYHQLGCSFCNLETCIEKSKQCLTSISIEEMLEASLRAISSRESRFY